MANWTERPYVNRRRHSRQPAILKRSEACDIQRVSERGTALVTDEGSHPRDLAVRNLLMDVHARTLIGEMTNAQIDTIIFKGPTIATWIYHESWQRNYSDVDLIVDPKQFDTALSVLRELGFVERTGLDDQRGVRPHSVTWIHPEGVMVDLHFRIPGSELEPEAAWEIWQANTEPFDLRGSQVMALNEQARTLCIALHAAHHGSEAEKPLIDLSAAATKLDVATWRAVADLARELGALEALAAGLQLHPDGQRVAADLGIGDALSTENIIKASPRPPVSLGIEWFLRAPGLREKWAFLRVRLFPRLDHGLRAEATWFRRTQLTLRGWAAAWRRLLVLGWPGLQHWLRGRRQARERSLSARQDEDESGHV